MDISYLELKTLTDQIYSGIEISQSDFHNKILALLGKYGIKIRNKVGENPIVTISIPTSLPNSIVVGLRYTKQDGSKTEDHFLFQLDHEIKKCYKRTLENILPEYKGAHKLQR